MAFWNEEAMDLVFDELADEQNDLCVCGRALGPEEREAILERMIELYNKR